MSVPTVVILGAGFGGVYTALHLRSASRKGFCKVILVNDTNYFLFTPLLHEVATGGLTPLSITEPIREVFRESEVDFVQANVQHIDLGQRVVRTSTCSIPFDYLVLATGAETDFHSVPGAKEHSFTLKSLPDAARLRSRIIDVFERASRAQSDAERKKLLSFLVVGGGATGVEFCAELAEFIFDTMCKYYCAHGIVARDDASLTLISRGNELITTFHPALRRFAKQTLEGKGVSVRLSTSLTRLSADEALTDTGARIAAHTTIFVGGVTPRLPDIIGTLARDETGKVLVDQHLSSVTDVNVFALGDVARLSPAYPLLAQVAVKQATTAAYNIVASIKKTRKKTFTYRLKGLLISVGQWNGAFDIAGVQLTGRFAWWLWRTVYLFNFISWKKRLKIAVEWTINLFYPRDITKLL